MHGGFCWPWVTGFQCVGTGNVRRGALFASPSARGSPRLERELTRHILWVIRWDSTVVVCRDVFDVHARSSGDR
jgi:hypothetical protein